uniref:Uncharacterized protein n=1 Tax=Setaria italica TaxID=4555 RepID=K3YFP5_SETIT
MFMSIYYSIHPKLPTYPSSVWLLRLYPTSKQAGQL